MYLGDLTSMTLQELVRAEKDFEGHIANIPKGQAIILLNAQSRLDSIREEIARRGTGQPKAAEMFVYFGDFPLVDLIEQHENIDLLRGYNLEPENVIYLYGPYGSGKRTLAGYTAQEMGLTFRMVDPHIFEARILDKSPEAIGIRIDGVSREGAQRLMWEISRAHSGHMFFLLGEKGYTENPYFEKRFDRKVKVGGMSETACREWLSHVNLGEEYLEGLVGRSACEVNKVIVSALRKRVLSGNTSR